MRSRFPLLVCLSLVATLTLAGTAIGPAAQAAYGIGGIDVSHWQGAIDWPAVQASGKVDFAIVKATQGKVDKDPTYKTNASGAVSAGIPIGMYHVATPSKDLADARAEADHFLKVARPNAGNLLPVLDIELKNVPAGMSPATLESWMRAWLNRVTNVLGARPMVYGSQYLFETKLANSTWFADHGFKLWFAWPRTPLPPSMPANDWQGQSWTLWQWSWTGSIPGISGDVDRDRYAGTNLTDVEIASITAQPGTGGAITDSTGRLSCLAGDTCTELYSPGDIIQLTASAAPGYALVSWGGACQFAGSAPTCTIASTGNQTVTATFSYRLRVHVRGTVRGSVTSGGGEIDCPGTCAAPFAPGSNVTLSATTGPWSGVTWSGDCSGTDPNGCAITMDGPHDVTATFADLGPAAATIKPPNGRNGPVRVAFDQPVHHVTRHNLLVRPAGGARLPASIRCFDGAGHRTDCGTGRVRVAVLQPRHPLKAGRGYVALVDPVGERPIVDGVGNATPLTKRPFSV
jgi:GH25 family lysozyme M1 (1,4-beta-N-acetylmuramidase)